MAEVVELQSIGVSDKRIVEDEAVYEVPDLNKEDENEYMRLDSLVPTANETAEQETINTDGPSKCVSSSTAPTNLSDTERRLLVLCIVLAAVVVISSVSCGILINVMMKRLDETEEKSDHLFTGLEQLQLRATLSPVTDSENSNGESKEHKRTIEQIQTSQAELFASIREQAVKISNLETKTTDILGVVQKQGVRLDGLNSNITYYATANKEHATSISHLESASASVLSLIQDHTTRITTLESRSSSSHETNQDHAARITTLESDSSVDHEAIQTLESRITQLYANMDSYNASLHEVTETFDMKITQLDAKEVTNNATFLIHYSNISQLEADVATVHTSLHALEIFTNELEDSINSQNATINYLETRLFDLETNATAEAAHLETRVMKGIRLQNISLTNHSMQISQLQMNVADAQNALLNHSSRLTDLETGTSTNNFTLQDHYAEIVRLSTELRTNNETTDEIVSNMVRLEQEYNIRIIDLEGSSNESLSNFQTCKTRITDIEDEFNCSCRNWTEFSTCSLTCGGGTQYRVGNCYNPNSAYNEVWCSRRKVDFRPCNTQPCPVNGSWSHWGPFSNCSRPCNGGTQTRLRTCDNPRPAYGGSYCSGERNETRTCNTHTCPDIHNCKDVMHKGIGNTTGVYTVYVDVDGMIEALQVYCDMDTDGGGYTVFQKRFDGSVDFYLNFSDYEYGFGSLQGEFWLGLKWVYYMTKDRSNDLRIDMISQIDKRRVYSKHSYFRLGEPSNYTLNFNSYHDSGTAGRALYRHNGYSFTTKDNDQDMNKYVNCAVFCHGAFWYEICGQVNLNGQYGLMALEKPYVESDGFYWNLYFDVEDDGWDGFLSASEMKFREQ